MTVLMTMAGLGSRFKDAGYVPPKFRILARGRTLMDWSILSLQAFFGQRFIFACLAEEDGDWIRSAAAALGIADAIVVKRLSVSRGQAETALDALVHVVDSEPLWIYNIDTCVAPHAMSPQHLGSADGCVPVFPCSEPNMSFVRFGAGDEVIEIAEKRPISNWATIGLYGFRSAECFARHYQATYESGHAKIRPGERYVAPMYESMLREGERVCAPRLAIADVNILGTPDQILRFDPAAHPPFGNQALPP